MMKFVIVAMALATIASAAVPAAASIGESKLSFGESVCTVQSMGHW